MIRRSFARGNFPRGNLTRNFPRGSFPRGCSPDTESNKSLTAFHNNDYFLLYFLHNYIFECFSQLYMIANKLNLKKITLYFHIAAIKPYEKNPR